MRLATALFATVALSAALTACGNSASEDTAADTATSGEEAAAPDATAEAETAPEATASEAPDSAASASASPAPSASASAAPAAAAAPAAPPQSFTTCAVCHSVQPGQNGIGPSLAGVVGRRSGSVAGVNYSPAMQAANLTWNEANLRRYLADPNAVVPGGLMPPPGLTAAQVTEVVNYLKTL